MKIEEALKTKFNSEEQKGTINLMYTANWMVQQIETLLKPMNLSNEQYNVLRILRGSQPETLCLRNITERMINPNCNTTRVVDKLVLKNLVVKQTNGDDRRELKISITKEGLHLLAQIDSIFKQTPPKSGLIVHEWYLLNELMDKLRTSE